MLNFYTNQNLIQMKHTLFTLCFFMLQFVFSQDFVIQLEDNKDAQMYPILGDTTEITTDKETLEEVFIVIKKTPTATEDYKISIEGRSEIFTLSNGASKVKVVVSNLDLNGKILKIKNSSDKVVVTTLINLKAIAGAPGDDNNNDTDSNFMTAEAIVSELFPNAQYKQRVGIMIPSNNPNTKYGGNNFVHIFLDGYGNPILRAIPQGSPEKTYVIHVVTSIPEVNYNNIRYNIKQTAGGIDDILLFRNSGKLDGYKQQNVTSYVPYHYEIALTESNKNIVFEVNRGLVNGANLTNTKLSTHTIPIKVYHGSFDIGLISSELENPSYSFIASADDETTGRIKRSDMGNRGIVTTMATFYASPVVFLEKFLFKPKDKNGNKIEIPNYKLTGRNFVSDHKIYERIYPTVGLSINETALENIFYGFNFEAVRGASLFVGWHHGRVNTFNNPTDDFSFNETVISKGDFDINTDKKWKTDFAIGVNLDILVILNLLQQGGSATKL